MELQALVLSIDLAPIPSYFAPATYDPFTEECNLLAFVVRM